MNDSDSNRQFGINIDVSDIVAALKLGNLNSAIIAQQLSVGFAERAAVDTALAATYSTAGGVLISTSPGYLVSLSVTTVAGSSSTGLCYDSASLQNVGSTNAFAVIPSSGFLVLNWPFQNGLVVQPSSQGTHTVSVSYI